MQGVGFRPFVYRLAQKYLVKGWVLNATDGVFIHAEAEAKLLDEFVLELSQQPPAASKVDEVLLKEVPLENFTNFEIRFSDAGAVKKTTLISPDLATCDDCVCELFDPSNRRFRYPFINCTNCGPRFTIIDALPYDRKNTSMKDFEFCKQCNHEYTDPLDRRFHAQPDACFVCGPHISWREHRHGDIKAPLTKVCEGSTQAASDAIFSRAVKMLLDGKILAVKGLGGYHLVCDANNAAAVALLRRRKHRQGKAFAVMVETVNQASRICQVNAQQQDLLQAPQRPIVLLPKRENYQLTDGLADKLSELGLMLPATPVQHLLVHDFCCAWEANMASISKQQELPRRVPLLLMTSGNIHDEPIVTSNEEAQKKLFSVADAFLGNNRDIRARYDDSVVRVIAAGSAGAAIQFIRRARGYAPLPLKLPLFAKEPSPEDEASQTVSFFATGPEQKNTFTLTRGREAFISQHLGNLENAETYDAWLEAKCRFERLFEIKPTRVVCDEHPEYLTSKWAASQLLEVGTVQHHHAHIAAVMGENSIEAPTCGIAFDGTGFGRDGMLWGGEVLLCNLLAFERFANFVYVPMPGGAACIKHPLRMAYGVLSAFDLVDHPGATEVLTALGEQVTTCAQMIERSINTPQTSSVGRLFDAASALLGVCTQATYEGQPAIELEAEAWRSTNASFANVDKEKFNGALASDKRYQIAVVKNAACAKSTAQDTSVVLFDAAPTFKALLDDKAAGIPVSLIARRFHTAFVQATVTAAELVRSVYDISTVALAGGVFMNRFLIEHALCALESAGFTVAINRDLPPNDGSISFGQAVVAWAQDEQIPGASSLH